MLKASWLQSLQNYLLFALAFVIPLPFIYSSIAILALTFVWLLQFNFRDTVSNIKHRAPLWPWLIFYLLHAVSYFYSTNKQQSLFDLQVKLSLIVFPIVIGAGMAITREMLEKLFLFFVYGITAIAIFCMAKASIIYFHTGITQQFFYHELVNGLDANAVYEAWYALFSISTILFFPWQRHFIDNKKPLRYILLLIQVIFFILLSSRTLIVIFVFLILFYLRRIFKSKKLSNTTITAAIVAVLLLIGALLFTQNPIKKRYVDILNKGVQQAWRSNYHNEDSDFSNLTLRLFYWRIGFQNINEHHLWLFGSGNGDVQDLQNKKLIAYGVDSVGRADLYNVNLHNMYIQSLFMLGIPGLICFLFIMFLPLFYLNKFKHPYLYFIFYIISILFVFQESAFETQAGIVFFSFFAQIFWCVYFINKNYINLEQRIL